MKNEVKNQINEYIEYLLDNSSAEKPMWNKELVLSGKQNKWNYIDGCMITALLSLYEMTGNERYFTFAKDFIDYFVQPDGSIRTYDVTEYNLDNINTASNLFFLYDKTGDEKYKLAGAITVVDISPGSENRNPDRQTNVGYCDGENYYFLPDRLFGSVADFYRRQDRLYPLSKNALFKIMREDGVIEQWDEKNGRSTRQKLINGRNARYLWIPRAKIDGRKEPEHVQQHMDEMTEVSNDPDNPFTD